MKDAFVKHVYEWITAIQMLNLEDREELETELYGILLLVPSSFFEAKQLLSDFKFNLAFKK